MDNRHEKLSCITRLQARKNESTIKPTKAVVHNEKSNKLKKTKCTKKQLEQDSKALRNENTKLNRKIVTLQKSKIKLCEQLKAALLDDEDYQCSICLHVFIKPSLLGCSHMFCKRCIDKWLEESNRCPTCRALVVSNTQCLNMKNIIQKRIKVLPAILRSMIRFLKAAEDM